jgi:rhamnose transport system permease protein
MMNFLRPLEFWRRLEFWDMLLAAACLVTIGYGILFVPNFFTAFNLSQIAASASEKALLILPMTLLIIVREIDLSVASILALTSVVFGLLVQASVPLILALPLTIAAGGLLGAFNGYLTAFLGLPSLVVTLGTMAMYRGIGYIFLGTGSVNVLPDSVTDFGIDNIAGTDIPLTIVPFLILAPLFAIVLQRTPTGKRLYALGGNPMAALYSGIAARRLTATLFVLSGAVCATAGIVYTARLSNARANNALGMELDVITIVLLGGVSVFGGKGRLPGVFLALILLSAIRNLLALNQVGGDAQGMVIGLILIASLLLGNYSKSLFELIQTYASFRKTEA